MSRKKRPLSYPEWVDMNQALFLFLLSKSVSLSPSEKVRVLEEMPNLSQYQIDSLIHTFLDERSQFVTNILVNQEQEKPMIQELLHKAYANWLAVKREFDIPKLPTERTWVKMFEEDFDTRKRLSNLLNEDHQDTHCFINLSLSQIKKKYQYPADLFKPAEQHAKKLEWDTMRFNTPSEVVAELKKTVIGQNEALNKLATLLFFHKKFENINRIAKQTKKTQSIRQMPILLVGSTGLGKTHLIKNLTKHYDLNLVMVDASTMVRTGIVGTSLGTIGRMIYEQSQKDIEKSEYSVIFLDEFDKLFLSQREELGSTIAFQLLTVLEGSAPFPVDTTQEERSSGQFPTQINTEKMLFILAGSFGVHEKILAKQNFGFQPNHRHLQKHKQLHLTEMGLPDELAGRIGQIICLNELSEADYHEILYHSPTSPFKILQSQLSLIDCTVELSPHFVKKLIADNKAEITKFGARGLYQAFNALPQITDILMQASNGKANHFVIE